MSTMQNRKPPQIAAVVLTHNSSADLPACLTSLLRQTGIDLRLIIVDNASQQSERDLIESQFLLSEAAGKIVDSDDLSTVAHANPRAMLVRNPVNGGYSAGNNIGLRLAAAMGCVGALIVNPDVRLIEANALSTLWEGITANENNVVAGPRIIGYDGADQNPLREKRYWEELLWFRHYLPWIKPANYVATTSCHEPQIAQKLHGCCLLLRAAFLQEIGYLDESVLLYCEEAILSSQVRNAAKTMLYVPNACAIHAHHPRKKVDRARHMEIFARSRRYYLKTYAGYGCLKLTTLRASYGLLVWLHRIRQKLRNGIQKSVRKDGTTCM